MIVPFNGVDISVVTFTDTLEKSLRYVFSLGLVPREVEVTDGTMSKQEINALITSISQEYEQEHKHWEEEQEMLQQKEDKKYENKDVKNALKVINSNVDRIDQILFIGR